MTDEAALLAEQVRVGALPRERLDLAACLGHEAACLAHPDGDRARAPFPEWHERLPAFGREVCARAAIAAALGAIEVERGPDEPTLRRHLAVAEDWALAPSLERWHRVANAFFALNHDDAGREQSAAGWATLNCLLVISYDPEGSPGPPDDAEEWVRRDAEESNLGLLEQVFAPAARVVAVESVVTGELVPWTLGRGDAVRDRCASPTSSRKPR